MKKFDFRLEKILLLKEFYEMEAKLKYAEVMQEKINLENKNIEMEKYILSSLNDFYGDKKKGDSISSSELSFNENYVNNLVTAIKNNEKDKTIIDEKLNVLREKLVNATKEKKTFEELKKRDLKKFKDELKKDETKKLDDIAGQFYIRNNN